MVSEGVGPRSGCREFAVEFTRSYVGYGFDSKGDCLNVDVMSDTVRPYEPKNISLDADQLSNIFGEFSLA